MKDQEDIGNFLKVAFYTKDTLSQEEFNHLNSNVSSEMFMSVMSVLEARLPCGTKLFKIRDAYFNGKAGANFENQNYRPI
jgi:hypothetical protein